MTDQDIDSVLNESYILCVCAALSLTHSVSNGNLRVSESVKGWVGRQCEVINYVATILLSEELPSYWLVENSRQ
jgi:hypothetical protein